MTDEYSVSIDDMIIGETTETSLHDADGNLLVASGVEITPGLIQRFRHRGITTLFRCKVPPRTSSGVTEGDQETVQDAATPERPIIDKPAPAAYSADQIKRIDARFQKSEVLVDQLVQSIHDGGIVEIAQLEPAIDDFIGELAQDPDPVVANTLRYVANLRLASRCVQFSVLGMAIGMRLGVTSEELRTLGSAGLVHDWPLFDLPITSRFPHQKMSKSVREQYVRHPLAAKEMLDFIAETSNDVKLLVTQVHERLDGMGYPRRLSEEQIHPLSRILGVADAYLTMTSPPKDFPRIVPCDAIAYMISGASRQQYSSKAVTGLLQAVTMYPIGSIVELSDASRARVIRSNGKDYGSPIVEPLGEAGRVIDLKAAGVFITRPVLSDQYKEVRLPDTYRELQDAISRTSV